MTMDYSRETMEVRKKTEETNKQTSLGSFNGRMEMTKIKQYKFSNLNNREEND